MDKHIKKILLHAQLDLVGLLEFATGLNSKYETEGSLQTLKELQELTGDPAGLSLEQDIEDFGN